MARMLLNDLLRDRSQWWRTNASSLIAPEQQFVTIPRVCRRPDLTYHHLAKVIAEMCEDGYHQLVRWIRARDVHTIYGFGTWVGLLCDVRSVEQWTKLGLMNFGELVKLDMDVPTTIATHRRGWTSCWICHRLHRTVGYSQRNAYWTSA